MATKNEKIIGTLNGVAIGGYFAHKKISKQDKNNFWPTFKGALIGGIGGYGLTNIIGSPNNTVNYTLFYRGKRVYEGITYEKRFDTRMSEHKANGKKFNHSIKDTPKPRVDAENLEKKRIIKYKPVDNIQHNK